ncbi:DeoR/GlpR family DNA-binding transcription regulator [Lacticaseibacillus paracasei]|uniref:DeoR/GlpR family DNA-binding transcription regulator n=1 Tax=Lacticaseibacillus paracasei TaxID=1597 RepID=A0ABD5CZY5_LACPA|nr:DeoR/GlpR family DNA-binding transcription regulator [Lacticaseibacillus paracasei]EPC85932.1 DeoR family transcriptional regulator [Lacticaseibacillus paracasei subsp. paracasei CNCM I-4649]MDR7625490.1 DeoR/GlpR family DNA-binding transcription regulator [Lacticaseibacillus paracasei]QPC12910.1 DeoR/GlpR transcriptional regulator [Lacticaseibacillus paracasei subsp. tolerans]QUS98196.1 DeoR/GlpR transcriptional regulator [Lacticaseibacillus paracasei subsp. tolerans]WMX60003.1 DeoR/GlpR f
MIRFERLGIIEDFLKTNGSVTVNELSKTLKVSKETIRKDLDFLASKRRIGRVHGGAYSFEYDSSVPYHAREKMLDKQKNAIARFTANLIEDGKILFMDSSTTSTSLLRRLISDNKKLTIITNSLEAANLALDAKFITVFLMGGELDKDNRSLNIMDYSTIDKYNADYAIISPSGVDLQTGITDQDPVESQLRKKFLERARKTILVIDHTKLNTVSTFAVGNLEDIDGIVIDSIPNVEEWNTVKSEYSFFIEMVDGGSK